MTEDGDSGCASMARDEEIGEKKPDLCRIERNEKVEEDAGYGQDLAGI